MGRSERVLPQVPLYSQGAMAIHPPGFGLTEIFMGGHLIATEKSLCLKSVSTL